MEPDEAARENLADFGEALGRRHVGGVQRVHQSIVVATTEDDHAQPRLESKSDRQRRPSMKKAAERKTKDRQRA
ncbi:MAG TPA: hypothetical protein VNE82_20850 [Candidatus Binataceae bacterium]|nr:hypothetical protein [Candidatus Binataceae bacterium]